MRKYLKEMMSDIGHISLMRNMVFIIIITACSCAIANIFIQKDLSTMIIGMLAAAGISKGVQSFAEK